MGRTFFIGCPHFGHTNIIKYENRPFEDTDHMNFALINNWNSVIKSNDDKVFILGDLTFCSKNEAIEIIKSLAGYKILILGNHDRGHSLKWFRELGINEAYRYPIIYKKFYTLSHEPLYVNDLMPYLNIHAHLHSNKMEGKHYFNVSVECINYTPIEFEEIKMKVLE